MVYDFQHLATDAYLAHHAHMRKMFLRQRVREVLCLLAILLFAAVGLILIQSQISSDAGCPKVVSAQAVSSTLYYVKNDGEPRLFAFRNGETEELDLEITPWSVLRISPGGKRLVHLVLPPKGIASDADSTQGIFVIDLPMSMSSSAPGIKVIGYRDEWPEFRAGVGWTDSENIYFNVWGGDSIEVVVLNVDDLSYRIFPWPPISEQWRNAIWGLGIFNSDLSYLLYPSSTPGEGPPTPVSSEAQLRLVAVSNPDIGYDLIRGYINRVSWQPGTNSFVFQADDFTWYRVNADEVVTGDPELYDGRGLSVFHEGIRDTLDLPSLSPDGHLLAVLDYLPDEQYSKLLLLPEESASPVDLCLHGDYVLQVLNTVDLSAVWSPDSQYIAFAVYADEQTGLYVYDVQKHTLGLVDPLKKTIGVDIVGWVR
jgi:hypothetical protein